MTMHMVGNIDWTYSTYLSWISTALQQTYPGLTVHWVMVEKGKSDKWVRTD